MSDDILFCQNCDYAISRKLIESAFLDFGCPRCKTSFADFYALGSKTHKNRREAFERGELKGSPLPFKG